MATLKNTLGTADVDRLLRQIPSKLRTRILTKALAVGAAIVLEEAKLLAPVDSGEYRDNLKVRKEKSSRRHNSAGIVSPDPRWHLLEYGHAYSATIRGKTYTGNVPAQPHLRPAAERKKEEAVAAVGRVIGEMLTEETKRGG